MSAQASTLIHVPFRIARHGGRKRMVAPDGSAVLQAQGQPDNALVKALARAFRWKRLIESGAFATINELAAAEQMAPSYMSRVLRLALLAPDIVEAILDGAQGPEVTLARLLRPFSEVWTEQYGQLNYQRPRRASYI